VQIELGLGRLLDVEYIVSPNCDERPRDGIIDLLVIHGISLPPGQFGGNEITALFTNTLDPSQHPYFQQIAGLTVSAHCLIKRDGTVIQFVPFSQRAWHAGLSCFKGRPLCNDFSIGIELEGSDEIPYSEEQYQTLSKLIRLLQKAYPQIVDDHIVGHSEIAPGRKTDPGPAFDWQLLRAKINRVKNE
jgi:AmpD protein